MSLQQANTSLARSRSLRVPAKAAVSAPSTNKTPLYTTSAPQIPSTTSNVSIFLTNLRLLDLDQEPDWPDITLTTFSTRDAVGGQRKRIQCVEWALYQLFQFWDPHEAQNKLRAFFPPIDQVQSINLRAALLRGLEQAKKNGFLGRDAVIRKTMLDECKGERLEEVLAVFSSAVLKKLVAERALNSGPEYRPTISESLALENRGYSGTRTELNGLLLAHKVSLGRLLTRRKAAEERYRDFEELLALKARAIDRRAEQNRTTTPHEPPDGSEIARDALQKTLKSNWTGNEQWIDGLLYGDTQSRKGGLLGSHFDDVWVGVRNGRVSDLEEQHAGILEQLDHRVNVQRARLEKWVDFRKNMFGDHQSRKIKLEEAKRQKQREEKPRTKIVFTGHEHLNIGHIEYRELPGLAETPPEYASLLRRMEEELGDSDGPEIPDFANLAKDDGKRGAYVAKSGSLEVPIAEHVTEQISDLSEWEDEPDDEAQVPTKPQRKASVLRNNRQDTVHPGLANPRPRISRADVSPQRARDTSPQAIKLPRQSQQQQVLPPPSSTKSEQELNRWNSDSTQPVTPGEGAGNIEQQPAEQPRSPTQVLADEILASMSNTSPSPTKKPRHTLTLTERTRLSMIRTRSFDPEADYYPPQPSPTKTIAAAPETPRDGGDSDAVGVTTISIPEDPEDLVARTRRSMAGFEAARQKAQLERRRSQRKSKLVAQQRKESYFPRTVEEEAEEGEEGRGGGDTSVVDELMQAQEEDYEAIFKSRPRIATSPPLSPLKQTWHDDEGG